MSFFNITMFNAAFGNFFSRTLGDYSTRQVEKKDRSLVSTCRNEDYFFFFLKKSTEMQCDYTALKGLFVMNFSMERRQY